MRSKLCQAIEQKKLIRFSLGGLPRIAEPHDYGVIQGQERLFFYQVGGASSSARPFGWRWAALEKMSGLEILERRFPGARTTPSGRHQRWDELIASVSRGMKSAESAEGAHARAVKESDKTDGPR
jgi:hypothetical protein